MFLKTWMDFLGNANTKEKILKKISLSI